MKRSLILAALTLLMAGANTAYAAPITISDTFNWGGSGTQSFTDASLPQWTHNLTFTPAAGSIASATLEIRHAGNKATNQNGSSGEFWLMTTSGNAFIGNLSLSSLFGFDFLVTDTFSVPASLFPALPAGSWALTLLLNESTNQTDSITLDWARLNVTYDPVAATSTPEPASLTLLGTGVAAALWRRRRQKRQAAA